MATIDELYQQSLLGNLPTTLTPYQRIMGQMTPTMNPYTGAGQAIAGYDPSLYNNAFAGSNSRLNLSGLLGGGRNVNYGEGNGENPLSPQTLSFLSNETPAERDGRMSNISNLISMAMPGYGILSALSGLLSTATAGQIANALSPLGSQPNYGIPVENAGTYAGMAPIGQSSYESGIGNPGESIGPTSSESGVGNPGESTGPTSSESGVGNPGESYYMGGPVDQVGGSNPPGPDDGTGMLRLGEYVIKKSAVDKYGQGLLDMINDGKIPAKKMKSLLG